MKQEIFNKAKYLEQQIFRTESIVSTLKNEKAFIGHTLKNEKAFIGHYFQGAPCNSYIPQELQERILPICEEYLKDLEKEFEEL